MPRPQRLETTDGIARQELAAPAVQVAEDDHLRFGQEGDLIRLVRLGGREADDAALEVDILDTEQADRGVASRRCHEDRHDGLVTQVERSATSAATLKRFEFLHGRPLGGVTARGSSGWVLPRRYFLP